MQCSAFWTSTSRLVLTCSPHLPCCHFFNITVAPEFGSPSQGTQGRREMHSAPSAPPVLECWGSFLFQKYLEIPGKTNGILGFLWLCLKMVYLYIIQLLFQYKYFILGWNMICISIQYFIQLYVYIIIILYILKLWQFQYNWWFTHWTKAVFRTIWSSHRCLFISKGGQLDHPIWLVDKASPNGLLQELQ